MIGTNSTNLSFSEILNDGMCQSLIYDCHEIRNIDLMRLEDLENLEVLSLKNNLITNPYRIKNLPRLKYLNLSNNNINTLKSICKLEGLQELYLDNNKIRSLRELVMLNNLSKLSVCGNKLNVITGISCPKTLMILNISNNTLHNIDILKFYSELRELNISSNFISNLPKLGVRLKKLDASNNNLTTMSFLENCIEIEHLDISDNYLTSLEGLRSEKLEYLNISNNDIENLEELRIVSKLKELYCNINPILTELVNCNELEVLECRDTSIIDFVFLLGYFNLRELSIRIMNNNVLPLEILGSCIHLEKIKISEATIVGSLDNLTHQELKTLNIYDSKIDAEFIIEGFNELCSLEIINLLSCENIYIGNCPKLNTIQMSNIYYFDISYISNITKLNIECCDKLSDIILGCRIEQFKLRECPLLRTLCMHNKTLSVLEISECPRLVELVLSYNNLRSLEGIHCPNLSILNVCSNRLMIDLEELSHMPMLKSLNIANNRLLENINGIQYCTQLRTLDISSVGLTSLDGVGELSELREINFYNNMISDITPLSRCQNLRKIDMTSNRIERLPMFLATLPHLNSLKCYDNEIIYIPEPVGRRLNILRRHIDIAGGLVNDRQNVHRSDIQKSVRDSIIRILDDPRVVSETKLNESITEDIILTETTKRLLFEFLNINDIHGELYCSFKDLLLHVWALIEEHEERNELKRILNQEISDSQCKCFTGRLSRLLNVLNGYYDDLVKITISLNEQKNQIMILALNNFTTKEEQETYIRREFEERGFEDVEDWLSFI